MILHPSIALRRAATGVSLVALASLLAACGAAPGATDGGVVSLASPTAVPGGSAAPSASVDPEEAMADFTACMKAHGVDVGIAVASEGGGVVSGPTVNGSGPAVGAQDPQTGATELDPAKLEAADKACRDLLPSGMLGDPNATIPPEQVEQMLGFAKCMREHGIDFPDPVFSGNGMSIQIGGNGDDAQAMDPGSTAFQDAQAACAADMPDGAPFVVSGPATETAP